MTGHPALLARLQHAHPGIDFDDTGQWLEAHLSPDAVPEFAGALMDEHECRFATLVVEPDDAAGGFVLRYVFHHPQEARIVAIRTSAPDGEPVPAISDCVHAADWHEREAEDLYGIHFAGHPFLGDFVLHDTVWPEGVAPMRRGFDAHQRVAAPGLGADWKPRRVLEQEGAIVFPVGPIWGDYHEAGLWLLETPGEQIHEAHSRLFFKYRAVEKIAEGETPRHALLLAERFSGNSAFSHAYALCQALERIAACDVPPRAQVQRAVFAEFERMRYHAASIAELTGSTGLAVGKSMSQEIEEQLLRLAGQICGHRYLFGICVPGGLARDFGSDALGVLRTGIAQIAGALKRLERLLIHTSSFLDRIEEMGTLRPEVADLYGVVGPVARASGRRIDLRRELPYGAYAEHPPAVPTEIEGDGFARLRVFFAEFHSSVALIGSLLASMPGGAVISECPARAGTALGWTEAPSGGTFHWLRVDDGGRIRRWRIAPPGFRNWHAFHRALEGAAFQDFPIILASFGLSVAESDR
jgi:formate hydrogenlyase subunit 5